MPVPVTAWAEGIFPSAKSLNMALYSSDGSGDHPAGTAFAACRPLLLESYTRTTTFHTATGGSQTTMSTAAGSVASSLMVLDTAGYFGQTSDLPGTGYYQYTPVIAGSAGDGLTAGGWTVLAHFVPLAATTTQTSVSADIGHTGGASVSGSRQAPAGTAGAVAPFFCDLVSAGGFTWQPAVTAADSASADTSTVTNATDSSGQTPRFYAVWSSVSATTSGAASFTTAGVTEWTAPSGVTEVTPTPTGAGAGGGAGNVSGGGVQYGGGGGGGGETASDTVAVTPLDNYPVTVGAPGAAGAEPGGDGTAGGNSSFSGDSLTVTGHGGSPGHGATTSADGTGGDGGTGSGAATHEDGGDGADGATGSYGGGGGSSASDSAPGNDATSAAGATAPSGAGPGGAGGQAVIAIVQNAGDSVAGSSGISFSFSSAVQAGNTVIVTTYCQGTTLNADPTVTLSDGTALALQEGTSSGSTNKWRTGIFSVSGVTGGQTGVVVDFTGGDNLVTLANAWEVSGLGASPGIDAQTTNTGSSSSYSASVATADAPDLWIAVTGAQSTTGSFSINDPGGSWTSLTYGATRNSVVGRMRTGYQIALAAGTMKFAGSLSASHGWAVAEVAFTAQTASTGSAPVIPPGGGGGGGFGTNDGGAGAVGQVLLSWESVSGGGYGTPASPAPYTAWSPSTRVGTGGDASTDVDFNAAVTDVVNFLMNPPVFRLTASSAQSIPNATLTAWAATSGTTTVDNYTGGSAATYVIQRDGLYLFHATAAFAANSTGVRLAGATINGTTYWGPAYKAASTGTTNCTKTQIFSLRAGDTVALALYQSSGGALALATSDQTRFFLTWLCAPGAPSQVWTPPDTTFRFASGTPGSALPDLFQAHLGNDLSFLVNRPFLLAYQTVTQSSLTVGAWSTVVLDTAAGIVHGDTGDPYSGWTSGASNLYTAPCDGWWLTCGEFLASSSSTSGARVTAGLQPSTSGGQVPSVAQDWFQVNTATSTAAAGAGASLLSLNYMLAGETLTPVIRADTYSAAYSTLAGSSLGGTQAPHWEACWISE